MFKKIDAKSGESITSALDLFSLPDTNVSVGHSQYNEVLTLNPIDTPPYRFRIESGQSFIDLSKIYLVTNMRLLKEDAAEGWVNITTEDPVAPIQGIGATFIANMKVILNGQEIYNSNGLNSFKTYMDLLLTYPKPAVDSYLSAVGWTHTAKMNDATDPGFVARRELFLGGRPSSSQRFFVPCSHSRVSSRPTASWRLR